MDFALIETLRWEPGAGFVRQQMHLGRMERSAAEFGFSFGRELVMQAMQEAAGGSGPLRVRVELRSDGNVSVATAPFLANPPGTVWRLALARTRLDSGDLLLRHKTTRRGIYEKARAEHAPGDADEVILANEHGEICEGTITSLFLRMKGESALLTPPAGCGLLPGILREELLVSGRAREKILTPDDLRRAEDIYAGNSLRGLIRGRITID